MTKFKAGTKIKYEFAIFKEGKNVNIIDCEILEGVIIDPKTISPNQTEISLSERFAIIEALIEPDNYVLGKFKDKYHACRKDKVIFIEENPKNE